MNLGYAQYNLTARLKRLESDQATFLSGDMMGLSQQKILSILKRNTFVNCDKTCLFR